MSEQEQKAILSICLMAAFADGGKDDREREQIRRIAESLSGDSALDLTSIYQDVLLKRVALEGAVADLGSQELKQLALEMAVCVCDADEVRSPEETAFLERLRQALGLDRGEIERFEAQADALATEPVVVGGEAATSSVGEPELDGMILNYSILNGALELLPQSLASMAIIPLQMKMVYRVGKAHGYELDRGHIKDFLATLGVGLTSQYVEQFGRKLVGGALRVLGGRMARRIGSAATGSAFSFATTYALGHVAKTYYSGGRSLDSQRLKDTFSSLLGEAKGMQQRYASEIEQKASTIDTSQLVGLVRGQV
jgi:uncharacterized protein (DUF697 family)/tellurite resistance protein